MISKKEQSQFNELVESWINGNKRWVYEEYIALSKPKKKRFMYFIDGVLSMEFRNYIKAVEG